MKKYLALLFISLLTHSQLIKQAFKMDQMPVFDGEAESNWNAPWESINQIWIPYNNLSPFVGYSETGTKTVMGDTDFSGRYKVMWNENANVLLFFVEIQDDAFIDGYLKPNGNYPNFDILELFVDENKSGGNHLFDSSTANAENAFAYHIAVNKPAQNQVTNTMVGAMDVKGTTWGDVVDYQFHFPNFAFKNLGNGKYTYELSLKLYKDDYNGVNASLSIKDLIIGQNIGLSIAYCDNDNPDGLRDHFFGSVPLSSLNNNDSYLNASLFGTINLATNALNSSSYSQENAIKIFPIPFQNSFSLQINDSLQLENSYLEIYNQLGQKIFERQIKEHHSEINTSILAKGSYFYRFTNGSYYIKQGFLISN